MDAFGGGNPFSYQDKGADNRSDHISKEAISRNMENEAVFLFNPEGLCDFTVIGKDLCVGFAEGTEVCVGLHVLSCLIHFFDVEPVLQQPGTVIFEWVFTSVDVVFV